MKKYNFLTDNTIPFENRINRLLPLLTIPEKVGLLQHDSPGVDRFEIPAYNWWNECLHGIARNGEATVFPQAIGMAAAFDRDLMFRIASAISDEARAKHHAAIKLKHRGQFKGLTFWTPNINIFRDPRWGRGQETYGEDPYLTAELGIQFVKGLQGDHHKYLKTAACAKHFAVHSGPEQDRNQFDAKVTAKDLTETYLPAFKALIDVGVEGVMGAYNRTNGEVCCGSETLLVNTLRRNWQFKGYVVSDCNALLSFHEHHKVTKNVWESAALALKMGCDLNCGSTYAHLESAIGQGLITEQDLDIAVKHLLMTRMKLGMFDPAGKVPYTDISPEKIHCRQHQELALEAAEKSIVMLKNKDNILPIKPGTRGKIFVVGPTASDITALMGNYHGISGSMVTFLEGIVKACGEEIQLDYKPGCLLVSEKVNPLDWATFEASSANIIIACMGLTQLLEGEEGDAIASATYGDRLDLRLPEPQRNYLNILIETGRPVVLVLTGGSPIDLREFEDRLAAILFTWYPGEKGGTALADILFGKTNPSGKLPITFPQSTADLPPFEDYSMIGRTYRYMTRTPLYPFGFGLSYSSIKITDLIVTKKEIRPLENLECSVRLENTGPMDGSEVVQLYISKGDPSPLYELAGFCRVKLENGKKQTIDFVIQADQLLAVNEDGLKVFAPGEVTIVAGNCSPGERGQELSATYQKTVITLILNEPRSIPEKSLCYPERENYQDSYM